MLVFKLELTPISIKQGINGFSRGHMTIENKQGFVTSKERNPDQSMMIFFSIVELLDGLIQLFQDFRAKNYTFVGTDCSFQFFLKRQNNGIFMLTSGGKNFEEVNQSEILKAIWNGINNFLESYNQYINNTDIIAGDLADCLTEFKEVFNI